jgi:HEAT repeat protein
MPLFFAPDVRELLQKKDVKGLIRALRSDLDTTYLPALDALGMLGDKRATKPVIKFLKKQSRSNNSARIKACECLGKLGDSSAIRTLIEIVDNENSVTGAAAARSLGKFRDPRAVQPLIRAMKKFTVRAAASEALVSYGGNIIDVLVPLLQDDDRVVCIFTLSIMGDIREKSAIPLCIPFLSDPRHLVGETAAEALDRMGWTPVSDKEKASYWIANKDFKKVIDPYRGGRCPERHRYETGRLQIAHAHHKEPGAMPSR